MKETGHNHRDEIEQALQASMDDYRVEADAFVWDNIEEALQRRKKRAGIWWMRGAVAAANVAALVLIYFLAQQPREQELPITGTDPTHTEAPGSPLPNTSEQRQPLLLTDEEKTPGMYEPENTAAHDTPSSAGSSVAHHNTTATPDGGIHKSQPGPAPVMETDDKDPAFAALEKMALRPLPGPFANETGEHEVKKRFYPIDPSEYAVPHGQGESWELAANFGSSNSQSSAPTSGTQPQGFQNDFLPNSNGSLSADKEEQETGTVTYHPPVILGVRAGFDLGKRLGLESGISYTLLPSSSESATLAGEQVTYRTEHHYLGIPLVLNYRFVMRKRFNIYSSQGFMFDKGIAGKRTTTVVQADQTVKRHSSETGAPGLQGAIVFGLGADYHITEVTSLYFQPGISSWLLNLNHGTNGRNRQLIWPNVQMGIRFRL